MVSCESMVYMPKQIASLHDCDVVIGVRNQIPTDPGLTHCSKTATTAEKKKRPEGRSCWQLRLQVCEEWLDQLRSAMAWAAARAVILTTRRTVEEGVNT